MKFLVSVFIVVSAIAFNGCAPNMESYDLEKLIAACKERGGVYRINAPVFIWTARCRDGTLLRGDAITTG